MPTKPNTPNGSQPSAIARWWPPPVEWNGEAHKPERQAWKKLGQMVMAAKTVSEADRLMCEQTALEMVRVEKMRREDAADTALNAAVKLLTSMFRELGLTSTGRRTVTPLPASSTPGEDPLDDY